MLKLVGKQTDLSTQAMKMDIIQSIVNGECTIPEDVVNKFNIPFDSVVNLFSDPNFIATIGKYTQAKLKMHFHSKTVTKITELAEDNDPKIALQAIKLEAQITNNLKTGSNDVSVNINLETLVKEAEKSVNPILNLDARKIS